MTDLWLFKTLCFKMAADTSAAKRVDAFFIDNVVLGPHHIDGLEDIIACMFA